MKKHTGMLKSVGHVAFGASCQERIKHIVGSSLSCLDYVKDEIRSLQNSSSLIDQITHVRQLADVLKTKNVLTVADVEVVVKLLVTLYLDPAIQKSPLHKALASSIDAIAGESSEKLSALGVNVEEHLYNHILVVSDVKEYIFCVKCLIESPPQSVRHGALSVHASKFVNDISAHLTTCLQNIAHSSGSKADSELHSADVLLGHTVCQIYFRLLSICGLDLNPETVKLMTSSAVALHQALLQGLGNMDLLISIGLCICQLASTLSRTEDEGKSNELFLTRVKNMLGENANISLTSTESSLSHLSTCSLLNGVVSTTRHHCLPLHRLILDKIRDMTNEKLYTDTQLVLMKMMVTWTGALSRDSVCGLFVVEEVYPCIFNHLFYVWEHSAETVRQSSREVFSNLLKALHTNKNLQLETLRVVSSYPWTRKGKYGFLIEYIHVCGAGEVLEHACNGSINSLLREVMKHISRQQLANYVSEFICSMMTSDKRSQDHTQSDWTNRWLIPLVDSMLQEPDSQRHVSQNLLPKIVKVWPASIVDLLRWLSASQASNNLDIYLMLARRARTGGLLAEPVQDDTVWCEVLSRALVEEALHSNISERRLAAFALICESHKTTSPITQYEYVWVSEFIRDNSFHSEPSFRQQMLSHLKHFLYHVLESSRKLETSEQQNVKSFLRTLGMCQVDRLRLGALTNHRAVALDILTLISQVFPYGAFSKLDNS